MKGEGRARSEAKQLIPRLTFYLQDVAGIATGKVAELYYNSMLIHPSIIESGPQDLGHSLGMVFIIVCTIGEEFKGLFLPLCPLKYSVHTLVQVFSPN